MSLNAILETESDHLNNPSSTVDMTSSGGGGDAAAQLSPLLAAQFDEARLDDDELELSNALACELSPEEALQLLQNVARQDVNFQSFTSHDFQLLTRVLGIVRVSSGDKIIAKDEEASFCGIVLSGVLSAIVSPTVTVPLRPGALVGEMALFEGGLRSADILAAEDSVIGVITFAELETLGATCPTLQRKLIFLFAVASIKKLRRMTQSPSGLSPTAAENRGMTPAPWSQQPSAVKKRTEEIKKEHLYRAKLSQQTKKTEEEIQREIEKRKRAEKNQRDDKVRLANAQRRLSVANERVAELEHQLEMASQSVIAADTRTTKAIKEAEVAKQELYKLNTILEEEKKSRELIEGKEKENNSKVAMSVSKGNKLKEQNEKLSAEINNLKSQLEMQKLLSAEKQQEFDKLSNNNNRLQHDLHHVQQQQTATIHDLQECKNKSTVLLKHIQEKEKLISDLRHAVRSVEARHAELEDRYVQLQPWKSKALELQQNSEMEKKRHARQMEDIQHTKQDLEDDIGRYQKILKFITTGSYVRDYRLRRSLAVVHEHVTDMLLNSMEENMNANNKVAKISIKSIKKRKRAYLATLLKAKSKARDLVASLDEEVLKLRAPMEEILERVKHWKGTAESFFQRNIQLTSEKEEVEKNLKKSLQKLEALKQLIKQQSSEYEEIHAKNNEMSNRLHNMKFELEKAQSRSANNNNNNNNNSSSNVNSPNSSYGTTAASEAHEHLQMKNSLLQQQIAQMEQHYARLSDAIRSANAQLQQDHYNALSSSPSVGSFTSTSPDEKTSIASNMSEYKDMHQWEQEQAAGHGSTSQLPPHNNAHARSHSQPRASPHSPSRAPPITRPVHTLHPVHLQNTLNPYLVDAPAKSAKSREEKLMQAQRERYQHAVSKKSRRPLDTTAADNDVIRRIESQYLFNLPPMPPLHNISSQQYIQPIPIEPQTQRSTSNMHAATLQPSRSHTHRGFSNTGGAAR